MDFSATKRITYILAILFAFVFLYNFFLDAPNNFQNEKILNVNEGSNLRSLSRDLQNENFVRSRVAFEFFLIIYGGEKHIKPGYYLFEEKVPVFEVARRLALSERHLIPIKVTIPEGFSVVDIAEIFSQKLPNFNKDNFLLEAKNKEGYLFPETYFFYSPSNENDVLKTLTGSFDKAIKTVRKEIISSGKTEQEIITMASILEKEAKGDADRGIISGILWKRIEKNIPLQVDAEPITYKTRGLPENPICNPGLEAIKASIHPVSSEYLFYLHDKDGVAHYAKTFAEHKVNIKKYLSTRGGPA